MYARVAKWEGADGDALRRSAAEMNGRVEEGPPEGVPATGFTMLIDPDSGTSMAISFFATEEDLRKGDETLNAMTPTTDGVGHRVSVETYEVPIEVRV
jgi:hypothetical protein